MTLNFESESPIPTGTITLFEIDNMRAVLSEPAKYDWFGAHLLRACQKADQQNLRKIATVYPDIAAAFILYHLGWIPEAYHDVIPDWESYTVMMLPRIMKEK